MTWLWLILGWTALQILTAPLIGRWLSTLSFEPAPAQFLSSTELPAAVDDRQVTRDGSSALWKVR